MKKIAFLLAMLMLLAVCFTACGDEEDDTPEEKTVALSLCGIKGPVRVTCARLDGELDAEPVKSEYFSAEVGEIYLSMPLFTTYLVTVEPME